mgnify:CR=1 FL=1
MNGAQHLELRDKPAGAIRIVAESLAFRVLF